MQSADIPSTFNIPWGSSAVAPYIHAVPQASQIAITPGAASLTDGFPPVTFLSPLAGGVPPFGNDMNGILNQITAWLRWGQAGGPVRYSAAFQTAIGGYPSGAIVQSATVPGKLWCSTTENNVTNPDTGGAGWIPALNTVYAPLNGVGASGVWGIDISGTAVNATNVGIADDNATNAAMYPTWVTAAGGNIPPKVTSTKLSFNPSSGILSASGYAASSNSTNSTYLVLNNTAAGGNSWSIYSSGGGPSAAGDFGLYTNSAARLIVSPLGVVTGTSFSGAGTGLTGTAAGLTAGNATNATNATNAGTNGTLSGATISTGSGSVTGSVGGYWESNNGVVEVTLELNISAVTSPSGTLTINVPGLPHTGGYDAGALAVSSYGTIGNVVLQAYKTNSGGNPIITVQLAGNNSGNVAATMQAGSHISISGVFR